MALVGQVGRKRARARFAMFVLYLVLCIGAVTTLYPFLLMAGTGTAGPTDQNENRIIPAYLGDSGVASDKPEPTSLFGKYLDDKYSGNASMIESIRQGSAEGDVDKYARFLMALPLDHWTVGFRTAANQVTGKLTMRYQNWLRKRFANVQELNNAYLEENVAFQTVTPPGELYERREWIAPTNKKFTDWLEFKATLPVEYRIPLRATRMFQEFLRSKFQNQISTVPNDVLKNSKSFEEIELPESGDLLNEFRQKSLPNQFVHKTVEDRWHAVSGGGMPMRQFDATHLQSHASEVKREFAGRNYRYVADYVLLNGRALWNTAIFCLLAVLTQLIVNPLAAYALSRFPMPATAKILLFLLATMAFPAEVTMIPSFLLLKDLGLLNTFAALVLPTAASGYMIFLLKGFFDSLPSEIFESAQIDGAKESTMMLRIAMPLSKPVLGYIALLAFLGAYGAFMYAFLVAQDQKMWTLMVWIYQLQTNAPKAVIMAAVTLAALPTLVVFLFAQRAIMRGIVLPGER